MALFGTRLLPAAALFVGAQAFAQAPAKPSCDPAEASKGNAARAQLSVNLAREAASPAIAATKLKDAVKLVEKVDKGDDPTTNAYVLGTAISIWANQPGVGLTPKRGALGFTVNPEATLDVPATLDSLFDIVEASKPACNEFTAYWRAGQKFYLDVVNGAINALNAEKLDSAEIYANQADKVYSLSPYGTMVLGSVYAKKNDNAKAVQYWTRAAEAAGRDTSYRDVRRQMLANIGNIHITDATTLTGAEKVAAAKKAADVYAQLLATPGTKGAFVNIGRQNMQNALMIAGDTAAAAKSWGELIANPSAYEYQDLLNSAVNAARASRVEDSGKLFAATLVANPYSRDALFNLAVTYLTPPEQNEKVGPIVSRLVDVDPANPDNYNLAARAYLAMAKAAEKAKNTKLASAFNDTTISWYNRGNKLPVEVTFREFSPLEKQVVISGMVLDRRDKADANDAAAQAATAPAAAKGAKGKAAAPAKPAPKTYEPRTYTLTFSALDKAGNVVGTETVTTNAIQPGKTDRFSVKIPGANIVGYRYKVSE